MLKFILPAIILFLTVLFWEKINELIYKKFNIKINYIAIAILIIIFGAVFTLLYFWLVNRGKLKKWKKYLEM